MLWRVQADLKNIPVMGWGMRQFEFLFLDRKWESDRQRLYRSGHIMTFLDKCSCVGKHGAFDAYLEPLRCYQPMRCAEYSL